MEKGLCEICNPKQWKTISSDMLTGDGYPVYGANGVIGYYTNYNHEEPTILITCRGATCGTLNICEPFSYVNGNAMALDNLSEEIDIQYLYYYLLSRGLSDVITGSAQPQIVRQSLAKVKVIYPSLDEQRKIAAVLDKVSDLIAQRRQQLGKLDEMVKSRFVEMFGNEKQFYKWNCLSIGDIAEVCVGVVIKPTQYYTDNSGIPAFRSLNVGAMTIKNTDWVYFTEQGHYKNKKSIIKENDVLVVRSGAPGTACVATKKFEGYNAIDIIIAHPDTDKVNSVFLAMFTNMPHGMNQIRRKTGGAAQKHFNVSGYKSLSIILPPIELQNQFAAFVEETEKIKTTISRSLEKLEILKKALMQEYFGGY